MTPVEFEVLKRIADAQERQAEAIEKIADYLSTIANILQNSKIVYGKETKN